MNKRPAMKVSEGNDTLKSQESPRVDTDRHSGEVAKRKSSPVAKAPAEKSAARAPSLAEKVKFGWAESAPAAISTTANKPAKTKPVAVAKALPKAERDKPGAKSIKAAKSATSKSKAVPVKPAASKSEVGSASSTRKSPEPKQAKSAKKTRPVHTPAIGPEVVNTPAPKTTRLKRVANFSDDGPGVPLEASAAATDPEIDLGTSRRLAASWTSSTARSTAEPRRHPRRHRHGPITTSTVAGSTVWSPTPCKQTGIQR